MEVVRRDWGGENLSLVQQHLSLLSPRLWKQQRTVSGCFAPGGSSNPFD